MTSEERARQETRVVELRRMRMPWNLIGRELGVTGARAHQIYQRALATHPLSATQIDTHRLEETELADFAVRQLMKIASAQATSARTQVEAWSAIRAWSERKARLLGLDAPTRSEVVTIDALDAEIARLETELSGRAAAGEAAEAPGTHR